MDEGAGQPVVSVMIPTYNQAGLIGLAIESVLAQDYPMLEVLVCDDCSTDGTEDVVRPYLADPRLKYFRNVPNLGRVANYRKTLYERVTGTWVLNLDGDDTLYGPRVISSMVRQMTACGDEKLVAVLGASVTLNATTGEAKVTPAGYEAGVFAGIDVLLRWPTLNIGHLATLYNVKLARSLDYYSLDTISSDWDSILRLIVHGNVLLVKDVVGVWNIHGANISHSSGVKKSLEDYSFIEESYRHAITMGYASPALETWRRAMIAQHTRTIWTGNARLSSKLMDLPPFVAKTYPFALWELFSPKSAAIALLKAFPGLYGWLKSLQLRLRK